MLLMSVCAILMLLGIAACVVWGGRTFDARPVEETEGRPRAANVLRRYVWHVNILLTAGIGAGLAIAGAGGRLAMRLVAATAGTEAQGRLTEADQLVGVISLDGTISFITFTALFFGLASGALYMLIRRWLPSGRWGGVTYGALLLVWFGSILEPLRPENPDFDIVGPGWVSVLAFGGLVLVHGMTLDALAKRMSNSLPEPEKRMPILFLWYSPLLLLVPLAPAVVVIGIGAIVAVGLSRVENLEALYRSRGTLLAGRVVGAAITAVALVVFASAVTDILGRGPS